MREDGNPYAGCLFVGLMIRDGAPRVVEFNSRFGDPETQVILPLYEGDLARLLYGAAIGELPEEAPVAPVAGSAVCVVMASEGYPGSYRKGSAITGISEAEAPGGIVVFHAGTKRDGERLVTSGGRVLGVTAISANEGLDATIARAYDAVRNIHFDNFAARLVHFDLDNDNMPDDWELNYGLDPDSSADAGESLDLDTLSNLQEFQRGTNPTLVDTDGDGIEDDIEVLNGTDPVDAASPGTRPHVTNLITTRSGGQITKIEVEVSGLVPNKTYTLVRSTDLIDFSTTVETKLATGTTYTFTDSAPLPGGTSSKAFYRVHD